MKSTRRPLVAGNWKMNGTSESLTELRAIAAGLNSDRGQNFDALICLPATLIWRALETIENDKLYLGGQDCHYAEKGAYTGDISAAMLKDVGATHVILGHSERRANHFETSELVKAKVQAACQAGLTAIVCIGEPLDVRETGGTLDYIGEQLDRSLPQTVNFHNVVIAYEPIWAIGSGKTPASEEIAKVHQFLHDQLVRRYALAGSAIRLLYGGSVNPTNAQNILSVANVDGALIGGASLRASDFLGICDAYRKI